MALNNHITVYYKNQLIYGIEPSAPGNNALSASTQPVGIVLENNLPNSAVPTNIIYPNPLTNGSFSIKLTPDLAQTKDIKLTIRDMSGKIMQTSAYQSNDGTLGVQLSRAYLPGVYFVQLNNLTPMRLLVNP